MDNGTVIRYKNNAGLAEVIMCPYKDGSRPCDELKDERNCVRCKREWLDQEMEWPKER